MVPYLDSFSFSSRLFESVSSDKLKKDPNIKQLKVSGEPLRYSNCRELYLFDEVSPRILNNKILTNNLTQAQGEHFVNNRWLRV